MLSRRNPSAGAQSLLLSETDQLDINQGGTVECERKANGRSTTDNRGRRPCRDSVGIGGNGCSHRRLAVHHDSRPHLHTGRVNGIQCAGQLTSGIQTPDCLPGVALFGTTFFPFFTAPCAVELQVNWHNLDTGKRGTATSRVVTSTRSSSKPSESTGDFVEIATEPGRVVFTVNTGSLHHVAAPAVEVRVPG